MAYNVKFLKGTAAQYKALAEKDVNAFYYVDGTDLYLGNIKLSNAADLEAAIERIAANENHIGDVSTLTTTEKTNLVGAVNEIKKALSDLIGGETGGITDMIKAVTGDLSTLSTEAKGTLVAAINEIAKEVDDNKTTAVVSISEGTAEGYSKVYTVKQGKSTIGTINIPKDMVVESGKVVVNPEGQTAGTYIELTLANPTSDKIYVNVGTLVDIYTAQANAPKVQLAINSSSREISATIVAKSIVAGDIADKTITAAQIKAKTITNAEIADTTITKGKLAKEVTDDLTLATTAVQTVVEGTKNGTVKVDGTDVNVHGLKSAAYVETTAFDRAGAAANALNDAKAYTDNALTWGTIA